MQCSAVQCDIQSFRAVQDLPRPEKHRQRHKLQAVSTCRYTTQNPGKPRPAKISRKTHRPRLRDTAPDRSHYLGPRPSPPGVICHTSATYVSRAPSTPNKLQSPAQNFLCCGLHCRPVCVCVYSYIPYLHYYTFPPATPVVRFKLTLQTAVLIDSHLLVLHSFANQQSGLT